MIDTTIKVITSLLIAYFVLPTFVAMTSFSFTAIFLMLILTYSSLMIAIDNGAFDLDDDDLEKLNKLQKDPWSFKLTFVYSSFALLVGIQIAIFAIIAIISVNWAMLFLLFFTVDIVYTNLFQQEES